MVGKLDVAHGLSLRVLARTAEALDIELTEAMYLEEPNAILGHLVGCAAGILIHHWVPSSFGNNNIPIKPNNGTRNTWM